MSKSNPFQTSMVRLQLPAGMGTTVSARGFTVEADADRCVLVPGELASEFMSHGLTEASDDQGGKKK